MKWTKETQAYMWAHYYSEDGNWKAWDEDITTKRGTLKHVWLLQNLVTGEIVDAEFKTLKAAKQYAEQE